MAQVDQAKTDQFAQRMLSVLNDGFLAMMMSIGHQTGLFDVMSGLPPSTSEAISQAAGLNERYVREWLGAMVVGRVVEHDSRNGTYTLPPEHAASLTRQAGSRNVATSMQWVACMGGVEERVVECFREGGGLPYSAYNRFHQVMMDASGQRFDDTLLGRTLPAIPGVVDRLTAGINVLDVGVRGGARRQSDGETLPEELLQRLRPFGGGDRRRAS